MARQVPPDRLEQLVRSATEVFIEQGYRRTQMADVARALGVAKGTVYLYVESKQALFDLACRFADRPFSPPLALPVPTPAPGATLELIRARIASQQVFPALAQALSGHAELADVVGEIYDTLERNKTGLKLIDRSARDLPELAELWFRGARGQLVTALSIYLERLLTVDVGDGTVAARFIVETCAFWAVHRHWDSDPIRVDDATARAAIVDLVARALSKGDPS